MPQANPAGAGLRERKRAETLERISDAAVRLFIANGYEATTLDAIAAAAGISRRTFFYYFKSKDDVLLSMQSGLGETIATAIAAQPPNRRPLDAAREALLTIADRYPADEMLALDRLMRSSEQVQARKQASYVEHEKTVLAALRERWPEPERQTGLQVVAMLTIGAVRLSLEAFGREDGRRPLRVLVAEAFDALRSEL